MFYEKFCIHFRPDPSGPSLELSVPAAPINVFVGPNGAGKSTLVKEIRESTVGLKIMGKRVLTTEAFAESSRAFFIDNPYVKQSNAYDQFLPLGACVRMLIFAQCSPRAPRYSRSAEVKTTFATSSSSRKNNASCSRSLTASGRSPTASAETSRSHRLAGLMPCSGISLHLIPFEGAFQKCLIFFR